MNLVPHAKKANVLTVLPQLKQCITDRTPLSLIRLGDGEGRLLGFPETVKKTELDFSLQIWFGHADFDPTVLAELAAQLRQAVLSADIIGLPRPAQADVPEWRAIYTPLENFDLLSHSPLLTDTAIHRYLQMGLFLSRPTRRSTFLWLDHMPRSCCECCPSVPYQAS